MAYLRQKNKCTGCRSEGRLKTPSMEKCVVIRCEELKKSKDGFCYDCIKYPCKRIRQLDKRYKSKYNMSMTENLKFIEENGIDAFLIQQKKKWTCDCGGVIDVHRGRCSVCGKTE